MSDNSGPSEIFHRHFIRTATTLDLTPSINSTTASLSEIIKAFEDHAIIKEIYFRKEKYHSRFHSLIENDASKTCKRSLICSSQCIQDI